MSDRFITRVRGHIPRATRLVSISAPLLLMLAPQAFAQAVAGEIDPETGLAALAPYLLGIVNAALVVIAMYKGGHAFAEGRSFGGIIAALVCGLGLADGGYFMLSHYGVTNAST